jgi:hypothetical protein
MLKHVSIIFYIISIICYAKIETIFYVNKKCFLRPIDIRSADPKGSGILKVGGLHPIDVGLVVAERLDAYVRRADNPVAPFLSFYRHFNCRSALLLEN